LFASFLHISGDGGKQFNGDGSAATTASLRLPGGVAVDSALNIFLADTNNNVIRKVSATENRIVTIAGMVEPGFSGDGSAAELALLVSPGGVALDPANNVYIADTGNHCIRKLALVSGAYVITTIAGTGGTKGSTGDGSAASAAYLYRPNSLAVDSNSNVYIADTFNNRIRVITKSTGVIKTIVGTGAVGLAGDGSAASSARLNQPYGVAVDSSGNVYVADTYNYRVRMLELSTGVIRSVDALSSSLISPYGIALSVDGDSLYVTSAYQIFKIRKQSTVTVFAGLFAE
jgi:DNA-binding beta-propeller fold protein YncE